MSVSETDVKVIAALAQLNLEDQAAESYVQEMNDILTMIQQMQEIDTSQIEAMSHPQDIELRLRSDELTEPEQRSELQSIAPSTEKGFYLVPKVLD
ncbi:MAG: Asp-tRNA(Asn)/Glu-tRNA(Gln) amidotransferase subunit GatC [Acidiferrobacterales bacterium]|nr:Asp-tRNA(Asn)/Glu-tRNA(Gln) amidotransferase subunit GatC [Acidiferrobacterales bacterium]